MRHVSLWGDAARRATRWARRDVTEPVCDVTACCVVMSRDMTRHDVALRDATLCEGAAGHV